MPHEARLVVTAAMCVRLGLIYRYSYKVQCCNYIKYLGQGLSHAKDCPVREQGVVTRSSQDPPVPFWFPFLLCAQSQPLEPLSTPHLFSSSLAG